MFEILFKLLKLNASVWYVVVAWRSLFLNKDLGWRPEKAARLSAKYIRKLSFLIKICYSHLKIYPWLVLILYFSLASEPFYCLIFIKMCALQLFLFTQVIIFIISWTLSIFMETVMFGFDKYRRVIVDLNFSSIQSRNQEPGKHLKWRAL